MNANELPARGDQCDRCVSGGEECCRYMADSHMCAAYGKYFQVPEFTSYRKTDIVRVFSKSNSPAEICLRIGYNIHVAIINVWTKTKLFRVKAQTSVN